MPHSLTSSSKTQVSSRGISQIVYLNMGIHTLYLLTISALVSIYLWSNGTFQRVYPQSYTSFSELLRPLQASAWGKSHSILARIGYDHDPHLPKIRSDLIEALYLLRIGDAWGAEVICQSLSNNLITDAKSSKKHYTEQDEAMDLKHKPFIIDIFICLGEARLLLHQQSYDSIVNRFASKHPDSVLESLLNTQILSSLDKLHSAKESFENSVLLDPMNPRARADLALSLLLLATRSIGPFRLGTKDDDQSRLEQNALDMLFDATLHFNAAVTITESWNDEIQEDYLISSIFHTIDKTMHVTSLYNNALAHLALGDHKTAMRLLKRVHNSMNYGDMSKTYSNYRMVSVPLVNLVGVLAELGQTFEALNLLLEMDMMEYCSSLEIPTTIIDRMTYMSHRLIEDRLVKICMIFLNNHDVLVELKTYSGANIHRMNDSSLHEDKLYEISNQLSEIFIKSHDMQDSLGFAKVNRDEFIKSRLDSDNEKQVSTTKLTSSNPRPEENHSSKSSVKHALNSLEKAALGDPGNSRMWLSLTRAKLVAGDCMGAVEAATTAINVANGLEEIEAATRTLEHALERLSNDESKAAYNESKSVHDVIIPLDDVVLIGEEPRNSQQMDAEVQSLRLERDILTLKLQLLQQGITSQQVSMQEISPPQSIDKEYQGELVDSLDVLVDEPNKLQLNTIRNDNMVMDMIHHNHSDESHAVIENHDHKIISNHSDFDKSHATMPSSSSYQDLASNDELAYHDAPSYHGKEVFNESSVPDTNDGVMEGDDFNEEIQLPVLYKPEIIVSSDISPTAHSYMKIADAHMEKGQFQQAAKQFSKVLKRHPDHLPASLGYATASERSSNHNQLEDVCKAYLHAGQVALKRGAYDLADAVMRRAIDVSAAITKQKRLGILKQLFNYSHTDIIAAEISFEIGRISLFQNDSLKEAKRSFHLANALIVRETGNSSACHAPSSLELGKIALEKDSDYTSAISFVEKALSMGLKESKVEGLVILGRSKTMAGDLVAAKAAFMEAIDRPTTEYSAQAHYHLGILLMDGGGDNDIVEKHFITALNLGLDATKEIIETLGEYHIAVIKSINRAKRREYENSIPKDSRSGGVLGGATFSDKSIFQKSQENPTTQSDTLSILEQGAASYDGRTLPDGEEMGDVQSTNLPKSRRRQS